MTDKKLYTFFIFMNDNLYWKEKKEAAQNISYMLEQQQNKNRKTNQENRD